MPPIVDPFVANGFTMTTLTRAISTLPILYGRLAQPFIVNGQAYQLFPFEPISTRTVTIDLYDGKLSLLPLRPLGSPGTLGEDGERQMISFTVPFIPHDNVVLPHEVQDVRALGSNGLETITALMDRKLQTMRNKHDITHEFLRAGALNGKIMNPNGSVLYNLYTQFGVEEKVISFDLDKSNTEVLAKCMELKTWTEENMGGDQFAGIVVLVDNVFMKMLITHAKVKDEYQRWRQGEFPGRDYRNRFEYGGLIFEQYTGKATDNTGTVHKFIAKGEGRSFPVGSADTFREYAAPGDFNETVNTLGERVYAKVIEMEGGRGYKLHTQSSYLALNCRPKVTVRLKAKAA